MSDLAFFGSDVINVKQAAKLKMDKAGYREVILSAFNYPSRGAGQAFYCFTKQLEALFSSNSSLMIRIKERNLFGEWGHPVLQPGESVSSFMARFKGHTELNQSHHIKSIRLKHTKDDKGNDIVLALGMVRPAGPYANCLENAFTNDEQNCSFSIRSASKRYNRNNRLEKEIHTIFNWDAVGAPGVDLCTKYNTPVDDTLIDMENLSEVPFTIEDLNKANEVADYLCQMTGVENDETITTAMIKDDLGWNKVETVTLATDWMR